MKLIIWDNKSLKPGSKFHSPIVPAKGNARHSQDRISSHSRSCSQSALLTQGWCLLTPSYNFLLPILRESHIPHLIYEYTQIGKACSSLSGADQVVAVTVYCVMYRISVCTVCVYCTGLYTANCVYFMKINLWTIFALNAAFRTKLSYKIYQFC